MNRTTYFTTAVALQLIAIIHACIHDSVNNKWIWSTYHKSKHLSKRPKYSWHTIHKHHFQLPWRQNKNKKRNKLSLWPMWPNVPIFGRTVDPQLRGETPAWNNRYSHFCSISDNIREPQGWRSTRKIVTLTNVHQEDFETREKAASAYGAW